ncbi:SIS domain-containing protein [Leifsonia sp. F6_8S_P_1B]|uniref:SIS domain-containing protein n=1 Tax=Leifsonia williamsii TaxID=3035919 RepID=A0ABT8K9L0_9MICO|nr:SIS domain-containing protein [Leifsonia williamsii]MDN4614089.1 SIS domain-containing protein [Leifsonia williamsii]
MTGHEGGAAEAGRLMRAEIAEQPEVWARLLARSGPVAEAVERIRAAQPRFVTFIARGTSDHAATYGRYAADVLCGLPGGSWSPSTTTLYGARPDLRGSLAIGVSQSGGSPDLAASLAAAREGGALTLAITNDPASALAQAAELQLDLAAGPELAVAATKSFTAELITLAQLFLGLAGRAEPGLERLPEWGSAVLRDPRVTDGIAAAVERFDGDRVVLTGRGYASAIASEGALKLMETCYVSAAGFSAADLLHGPIAVLDPAVQALAFTSEGPAGAAMRPVLERIRSSGAPLLTVGAAQRMEGEAWLPLPAGVPELLEPVLQILPIQLLALSLARSRGLDPDVPRGLLKVTETR